MASKLNKPVRRETSEYVRDKGLRPLVVILYPAGHIGLRAKGCRSEIHVPLMAVYSLGMKMQVAARRAEKEAKKKAKQKKGY